MLGCFFSFWFHIFPAGIHYIVQCPPSVIPCIQPFCLSCLSDVVVLLHHNSESPGKKKPKISSNNTAVASWNRYWILSDDFIIQSCDVLQRKVRITEPWLRPLLAWTVLLKPFSEWWHEAQTDHDGSEFNRQDKRPSCLLGDIFRRQQTSVFSFCTNIC